MEQVGNFSDRRSRRNLGRINLGRIVNGMRATAVLGFSFVGMHFAHAEVTSHYLDTVEQRHGRVTAVSEANRMLSEGPIGKALFWGITLAANGYLDRIAEEEAATHPLFPYTKTDLEYSSK